MSTGTKIHILGSIIICVVTIMVILVDVVYLIAR